MKTKIEKCEVCSEETVQDIGKKQATNKSSVYVRRRTSRCRRCGTRTIDNKRRRNVKIIIPGKNQLKNIDRIEKEEEKR